MSSAEVQKKNRLGQISWRKRSSEKVTSLLYFLNLLKMIVAKLDFIIFFMVKQYLRNRLSKILGNLRRKASNLNKD